MDDLRATLHPDPVSRLSWCASKREISQEYWYRQAELRSVIEAPMFRYTQIGGAALEGILNVRRHAIAPLAQQL
jgi:hypothetical protein